MTPELKGNSCACQYSKWYPISSFFKVAISLGYLFSYSSIKRLIRNGRLMKCFVVLSAHEQSLKDWFCIVDSLMVPCKIPLEDKQVHPEWDLDLCLCAGRTVIPCTDAFSNVVSLSISTVCLPILLARTLLIPPVGCIVWLLITA